MSVGLLWGAKFINYEMNCIVICIGPKMAVKPGFTK